ncbi:alpha-glucan family phosphorylase [candidate division KSB1 bacterium]|nr:alpha-glucan family phosphorylase [candidate division KSB1 bacterium]
MKQVRKFRVIPALPDRLKPLQELAYNLWWSWNPDAIILFRRLDRDLWEETYHNPVDLLGKVSQSRLQEKMQDEGFLADMDRIYSKFKSYMTRKTWFERTYPRHERTMFAYFSAEYGLTECIKTYSGGLGVLSGDHLKASSDLGLPLTGIGLLYRQGYFFQYLSADGWQQEHYPENDFHNMPILPVKNENGMQLKIEVEVGDRIVKVQIWKIQVGRVPLYLLDTNIEDNPPDDRVITAQLYGGDSEMRIQQEILLGIGGIRALRALNIEATVTHMNEGHSAFLALERIRYIMQQHSLSFSAAMEVVLASNVFTTHTPVPAGIDVFDHELIEKYIRPHREALGLSREEFLGFGRKDPFNHKEFFCMAVLAIRMAAHCNGVSKLHGKVSQNMWKEIWHEVPLDEIPINAITNGVHPYSWVSREMSGLYERYLGPRWQEDPADQQIWQRVTEIPDAELWRSHERRRERLVAFARKRLRTQLIARGAPKSEVYFADEALDPEVLTIGFARRFATYKRAALLFSDLDRFKQLISNSATPVQFIFAGKAHPRDNEGKELIKKIVSVARMPEFRQHIVFLENYDINIARYLVQGVDVWLNTPRRPYEASGTSGMKVCFNGGLNLSILDGWWCEGYQYGNGWAIGRGEEYVDLKYQDEVEVKATYNILEQEVIPLFYERGTDGLPRGWIKYMKNSMLQLCPVFNVNRMITEYTQKFYMQAHQHWLDLAQDNYIGSQQLSEWRSATKHAWTTVNIVSVDADIAKEYSVGQNIQVTAKVQLGMLQQDDVCVEIFYAPLDSQGNLLSGEVQEMLCEKYLKGGISIFKGEIPCEKTGVHGFAVRILPDNPHLARRMIPGLILWG